MLIKVYYTFTTVTQCTTHSNNMVDKTVWYPSKSSIKLIGTGDSRMVYFCLSIPITWSTWMRTWDKSRLLSLPSCWAVFPSDERRNLHLSMEHTSRLLDVEPPVCQYDIPSWRHSNKPLLSMRHTSETPPPHASEMKEITPCGAIPIKIVQCYGVYNSPMSVPWPLGCLVGRLHNSQWWLHIS